MFALLDKHEGTVMLFRDSVVVTVINCATSFFGGFVIFSVLGFMSFKTGVPVAEVATDGLNVPAFLSWIFCLLIPGSIVIYAY